MAEVWVALSKSQIVLNGPGKASWGKDVIGDLNYLYENLLALGYLNTMFDSFNGDGSDGDRTDSSTGSLAIGSGKQYEDWTIDSGVTVTLSGDSFGKARIGVSGRLTIVGGLSMIGQGIAGGASNSGDVALLRNGIGLATGGGGGSGAANSASASGRGGNSQVLAFPTTGAAAVTSASGTTGTAGSAWSAPAEVLRDVLHLQAGPGGGGGGVGNHSGTPDGAGGAGGASGGCLVIECNELDFQGTGSINASGAAGSNGTAYLTVGGGGGGGGAGGIIIVLARTIIANAGSVTVSGGAGGTGASGSSFTGGTGGAGGAGVSLIAEIGA